MNWRRKVSGWGGLAAVLVLLVVLCAASVSLGAGQLSLAALWGVGEEADRAWRFLMVSRVPRTVALLLAGMSLAVAGLIMQMLVRNRFVEPTTAGTVESATLGILVITLLAPDTPVIGKMLTATAFALAGTLLFLALLRRVPLRTPFIVPLIGLILGGVIRSGSTCCNRCTPGRQAISRVCCVAAMSCCGSALRWRARPMPPLTATRWPAWAANSPQTWG